MNTLLNNLYTTQALGYIDDITFNGQSSWFPASATPNITLSLPPDVPNPLLNLNQQVASSQVYLLLKQCSFSLFTTDYNDGAAANNIQRLYADSQFFTSASIPASTTGNTQNFLFTGATNPFGKHVHIITRIVFTTNANITITNVEYTSAGNTNFQGLQQGNLVLTSNDVVDFSNWCGAPGYANNDNDGGIALKIIANNTAASAQTYGFAAFGSFPVSDLLLVNVIYNDVSGGRHTLGLIDSRQSYNLFPNILMQTPLMGNPKTFGNILIEPIWTYLAYGVDTTYVIQYSIVASLVFSIPGGA